MIDITIGLDNNEQELLIYMISDEALESIVLTGNGKAGNFTLWACTALTVCPARPSTSILPANVCS